MPKRVKAFFGKVFNTTFKKMRLEDSIHPDQFIGRTILASRHLDEAPEEVTIKNVQGCAAIGLKDEEKARLLKCFQINGTHIVSMLSFYTQLIDGKLPTAEEEAEFNLATDIKDIRETNGKKSKKVG